MSCAGHRAGLIYVDELTDHTADAFAYAAQHPLVNLKPKVSPLKVHCRYCGAQPGNTCQKYKRGRRGKFLVDRDTPHPDRKHDARVATEAVRALT